MIDSNNWPDPRPQLMSDLKSTLKHMRGRHDQRDHTRHDYLAAGLIGDTGGGGRRGSASSVLSNARGTSTSLADQLRNATMGSLANRRTSSDGGYVGARPERQASYGLQSGRILRAAALRNQAIAMGNEYRRRHRMMNATAQNQGIVAPLAMKAKPYGAFLNPDDPDASLFENPRKIVGTDPKNRNLQTNMDDFVVQGLEDSLASVQQAMEDAGVPADAMEGYLDQLANAYANQYEAHMRKGAATFAMDIQGFVGGEIYSNDDPEFTAARALAVDANFQMQTNQYIAQAMWQDMKTNHPEAYDKIAKQSEDDQMPGSNNPKEMAVSTMNLANEVLASWSRANPPPKEMGLIRDENQWGAFAPKEKPVDARQLARINPALASDILDRSAMESTNTGLMPANASASTREMLTMSLEGLWGMLHPSIQSQIARLLKIKPVYPRLEDPTHVFEDRQTEPLDAANQQATNAFKGMLKSLHSDGAISNVRVAERPMRNSPGSFMMGDVLREFNVQDHTIPHIIMDTGDVGMDPMDDPVTFKTVVMAHEFGHLIDASALTYGEAAVGDGSPLSDVIGQFGGLPDNVWQTKSPMVAPMLRILNRWQQGPQQGTLDAIDGPDSTMPNVNRRAARMGLSYLSQPREIFARLYEQWVATEMLKRLKSGENIDGVRNRSQAIRTIERMMSEKTNQGLTQRFFDPADYEEAVKDLHEIFSVMGWQIK